MNLGELAIKKNVVTIALTLVLVFAGLKAFDGLSRLEDPEFTIKDAVIITPYPGASAEEVEEEVTNVIELACQQLGQLWYVESTSSRGLSVVKAKMKDQYDKSTLPQVWDELRRKVNDAQRQLPPGAGPSLVNDDFGDVYGVYMALTGEGYTHAELYEVAKLLRRELLQVQDVKKIIFFGHQPEVVWIEMSRSKMATLGIAQEDIYRALADKNLVADAGRLELGPELIPINPSGEFTSEQEFGELLVSASGEDRLVLLRDVAKVRRGYAEPPQNILRYDGAHAIGIAVSTTQGGNVVTMGEGLKEKIEELESQIPLGMQLHAVAMQSDSVTEAISGFVVNLLEAVVIVVVVLLLFMGLQSGLIIGAILFITIVGSFIFMAQWGVALERISLGALIIALGMLVDNAIVIIDGMKVRIEAGEDATKAAATVVGSNSTALLGATAVAIFAFASVGTSPDSTGEYCRSLFQVILISLGLSWVTAVTTTPLLGKMFLKPKPSKPGAGTADPYAGGFFQLYRRGLVGAIRRRWLTVGVVVGLFLAALFGFGFVKNMFFPPSTRPQFFIDFYLPEGTRIEQTEAELARAEEYLLGIEGVTGVTTQIGGGEPRFLLTYTAGKSFAGFGVLLVSVDEPKVIDRIYDDVQRDLEELLPAAIINVRKFSLGPGEGGKIQLRISGPDRAVLRRMASKAVVIMETDPDAKGVRDEWREPVKVVRPLLAEAQARQLGITRPMVADALHAAFEGKRVGVYREGEELLPIIARAPENERRRVDSIRELQIWSPAAQSMIPMRQVLTGYATETEDANILRRHRTTMILIHCDPSAGLASELFERIKPRIEQALDVDVAARLGTRSGSDADPFANHTAASIPVRFNDQIPIKDMPGYSIAWGGEAESSAKAQQSLAGSIPIFFGLMILTVVFLFNAVRQPLIIWLTVPLALIGVTVGLLAFKQPFGFMALLGLMSLSGMLIKNAIVLIETIDQEIEGGKERYQAVVDSGVSRMRPVMMAALTTILGMIPLLTDAFFISMAVTIMFGLLFATLLTLIVVPVLYTIFFRIPNPE